MSHCQGDGECLKQCYCECYNEDIDKYDEICTCGHRDHGGYCPSTCCSLVECGGCKEKHPKCYLDMHNGVCVPCDMSMGRRSMTDIVEDCCVCFENKQMLSLKCNHKVCHDCWYQITKGSHSGGSCPLCRNINGWGRS